MEKMFKASGFFIAAIASVTDLTERPASALLSTHRPWGVDPHFTEHGFFEKNPRHTEQFGHIAHVWSTYESRHGEDDPEPFIRGINSIQLFHDGNRWWIVNIYWQQERVENPIPEKYL